MCKGINLGIIFKCPEFSTARQARNTRFETRADMIMVRRMSAGCERCYRPQIELILDYCILRLLCLSPWERGTRNLTQPLFPTGGRNQVHGLSQFHREIGVSILFVDVTRGVAEHNDVKMASSRHTFYIFFTLDAGTQESKS